MKHLLYIADFIPRLPRPFERWFVAMAQVLSEQGIQMHYLFSGEGPEWFRDEMNAAGGVLHIHAEMRGQFHRPTVDKVIAEIRPQSVCVMFYPMLSPSVLRSIRAPGVQRTYYIDQSSQPLRPAQGLKRLLTVVRGRLLGRAYHRFITVADFKRERLVTCLCLPPERIVRIYNGVPLERFASATSQAAADAPILYAGQIADYKGVGTLVKAWQLANQTRPMPTLLLAGNGPMREQLEQQVAAAGLQQSIQFLGLRADVPEMMMTARAIVIPSEWDEACAFVALEAMASGRPVLASTAGSLPELLGEHGKIFAKGNATALAEALLEMTDPAQASQWDARGKALRERAQVQFGMKQMVKAYAEVLAEGL